MNFSKLYNAAGQWKFGADIFLKIDMRTGDTTHLKPLIGLSMISFACELLLKCLLIKEGNFKPIHDLDKLFESLREDTKQEVIYHMKMGSFIFYHKLKNNAIIYKKIRYFELEKDFDLNAQFYADIYKTLNHILKTKYGVED